MSCFQSQVAEGDTGVEVDTGVEGDEDSVDGVLETVLGHSAGPTRRAVPKTGRNEDCPCGSGKKYKKCCGVA